MWDTSSGPVPRGALRANVFIGLSETIRKDSLCTPAVFWGGRWRPFFLLWQFLEGREIQSRSPVS